MILNNSLNIVTNDLDGILSIDHNTIENLEILYDKRKNESKLSLFGIINQTKTTVGYRLLRSNLLCPSNNIVYKYILYSISLCIFTFFSSFSLLFVYINSNLNIIIFRILLMVD